MKTKRRSFFKVELRSYEDVMSYGIYRTIIILTILEFYFF